MAFEQFSVDELTHLYADESLEIVKYVGDPALYLVQDEFDGADVVELNKAQQLALYVILKNRFEA
jgi:hypothetical protein